MNARVVRVAFIVIVALAIAAFAYYAFSPRPVSADIALVTRGPLDESVDVEAKTRVRERYTIAAPVAGRLLRLKWLEGQRIRKDEVVAEIDPLSATAAVDQTRAQLAEMEQQRNGVETLRPKPEAIAQAETHVDAAEHTYQAAKERQVAAKVAFEQAERDVRRSRELESKGYEARVRVEQDMLNRTLRQRELLVATRVLQGAEADVRATRAALGEIEAKRFDPDYLRRVYESRIVGLQAQLRQLEDQAARTTIRAPADGVVLRVLQKSEDVVPAGALLVEVGDVGQLEIVSDVLSQDAVNMRPGDPIVILRGASGRVPRARVRLVEPAGYTKVSALGIEEQRVNVIGDFIDRPLGIGDQYRLDVRIVTWQGRDVLRAPAGALFRCENQWCAYAVRSGRAQRVVVKTGHEGEDDVEILSGLSNGDSVLVHPSDRIRDGVAVRPLRRG